MDGARRRTLGWMFDGFEIGMFPLVGPNALDELLRGETADRPDGQGRMVRRHHGGVSRRRRDRRRAVRLARRSHRPRAGDVAQHSHLRRVHRPVRLRHARPGTSPCLRFIASLGMGGEWSLGVALVTELWPDRSRAFLAGPDRRGGQRRLPAGRPAQPGAGELHRRLSATCLLSVGMPEDVVDSLLRGDGWRLMMIAGALPALLVFFIRLFVPESHKWEAERDSGGTSHWATRDLLGVLIGAIGAAAGGRSVVAGVRSADRLASPTRRLVIRRRGCAGRALTGHGGSDSMVALVGLHVPGRPLPAAEPKPLGDCTAATRRYLSRMLLGACLAGVALLGTWGSLQWAPKWADRAVQATCRPTAALTTPRSTRRSLLASARSSARSRRLGRRAALGRRITYVLLCIGSFVSLVYLYQANDAYGPKLLASVFVAGGITAAFYGWFPLYLPELFPTSIRATSQGFAYNFGRVLSAVGSLQTAALTAYFAQGMPPIASRSRRFPKPARRWPASTCSASLSFGSARKPKANRCHHDERRVATEANGP